MRIQKSKQTLSLKDSIESRRSIRKFIQETIQDEEIQEIFNLVRLTPSAWNIQPWHFHIIKDIQLKEKLQEAAYGQRQVTSAPAVVIISVDMENSISRLSETIHPGISEDRKQIEVANLTSVFEKMSKGEQIAWGLTQANIALGFLLLAIQGLGYSSVPMLGFDQAKVKELLGLPEHVAFAAMVPFGRPDSDGYEHHRFDLNKIITFH
ncbi:nitroreductase family protein [Gottfriedia sp. NPDC058432]|uniref:nitroreductase family protein n=1 Tax=Gottfriedia sp. NPDC058432 TaxID=3346497 RepID=UPI00364C0446